MAAFLRAEELGAQAMELDVRLSRDGVPVVFHDPTLERMAGIRGRVADYSASELSRMRIGSTVGVPALRDVLAGTTLPLIVELKEVLVQEPVAGVILAAGAAERVVVASEHHAALEAFRRPPFLVGASASDILALWLAPLRGMPDEVPVAYSIPYRHKGVIPVATRRAIRDAHALGVPVHVWTVDDPALARKLWDRGANGIVTNNPALILRA